MEQVCFRFSTEKVQNWREAVYSEIGITRSVSTADWSYVAFYVPPMQRTKAERVKEAGYYYGEMLTQHPWMEGNIHSLKMPYFQLGMNPGGFAFERWQLKDPKNTPWAQLFRSRQLYYIRKVQPKKQIWRIIQSIKSARK